MGARTWTWTYRIEAELNLDWTWTYRFGSVGSGSNRGSEPDFTTPILLHTSSGPIPHLYRAAMSTEEGALPVQHIMWASGLTQPPLITVELKIHEHPYMEIFCPSQHTEVLVDREHSQGLWRSWTFSWGTFFWGWCRLGLGSVWNKFIGFCTGCVWWGILWKVLPSILRMRRRDGIPDGWRSITILYNSFGTHGQSAVTKSHRKVPDGHPCWMQVLLGTIEVGSV